MSKPSYKSGAYIFIFSINGSIVQPYSNLSAAYDHFKASKTKGYTEPLSYSQVMRKMNSNGVYSYTSLNHIIYTIIKYSVLPSYTN